MPRQVDSSFWNSAWWMIWLTCAVSFLSSSAIIASMVPMASFEISAVSDSASSARVRTARFTSSRALSVRGLNSFFRSAANPSPLSVWTAVPPC